MSCVWWSRHRHGMRRCGGFAFASFRHSGRPSVGRASRVIQAQRFVSASPHLRIQRHKLISVRLLIAFLSCQPQHLAQSSLQQLLVRSIYLPIKMPVKPHWCQLKSTTTSNGRKGRPKFIFGKTRIFENGTWSAWHDLTTQDVAPDGAAKIGQSFCTLTMSDGASIKYYPRMLPEERRSKVAESCRNCQNYRQYRTGMHNEPRVHVLFNNNEQLGYRYHTVSMQPEPLSSVPIIESLATDLAAYHRLPHNSWNIGCNAVVYSDGTQNIGWHADDTQAEDTVLTYVPEAPDDVSRPVYFRTKRKRGESAKEGYEEYRLFIRSGDGCKYFTFAP